MAEIFGISFYEGPCNCDHIDSFLSITASRLYILNVCNYYGYAKDQLNKRFDSLIM